MMRKTPLTQRSFVVLLLFIAGLLLAMPPLRGEVDASGLAGLACDDPTQNLAGNGNNNGVLDAGDFPCIINLPAGSADINAFCEGPPPVCGDGAVDPGEQCDDGNTGSGDGCSATCQIEFCGDGVVQAGLGEQCDDGNNVDGDGCRADCTLEICGDGIKDPQEQCDDGNTGSGDGCSATCQVEPPVGGEGCTPGFWKQSQHFDSWPTSFTPSTLFSAVFENAFPGMTLLQVLEQSGGGLKILGGHTVAALLNAASPDVNYDLSQSEVINMFNAVFPGSNRDYNSLKNTFEGFNQQGCPLN